MIAWPWAVLFIFSASPTVWASGTLAERIVRGIIVGTLTYIPVGIVMWLASISLFRHRRSVPVPIALVALAGGIAWTTRSLSMIAYLDWADLPSDASPALRLGAGFIQGAFAFVLTAWLLAKLTSFYEQRRRLLDSLVHEELANERLQERVRELHTRVITQVRRTVDATVQRLDADTSNDLPSSSDVEVIARATKEVSKDLARELWADAAHAARVNPLNVVRSTATNRPFAYWALLPGALLGVLVLPIYWSVPDAVMAVSALTLFALMVSFLANAVCPAVRPSTSLFLYGFAIALLLASGLVMQGIISLLNLTPTGGAGLIWAVSVNFGVFYPLMGAGAHIGRAQRDVLAQLRKSISQAEIDHHALVREESRLRHDLALTLHGGLQADLTASTMRAQRAVDEGDVALARQSVQEARELLQRGWHLHESTTMDLQNTVSAVVDSWEGFVDIALTVDVSREPAQRTVSQVREILLEGIGNAVRHGQATSIDIILKGAAGDLFITITDDGTGVTGSAAGLGSAMLDTIAPNAWSLTPSAAGGSKLTVTLGTAPST